MRACVRTFTPREQKYLTEDPKFKLSLLRRNGERLREQVVGFIDALRFLQSCFTWESPIKSLIAFVVYLLIVWNFELYMLPLRCGLLVFLESKAQPLILLDKRVGNLLIYAEAADPKPVKLLSTFFSGDATM